MAQRSRAEEVDAWVLATAPRAMAYARSLLRNLHQAEDIVQDCYCRLIAKQEVYDLPRDGLKLLLASISNACINLRTRRKPMARLAAGGESEDDVSSEPPDEKTASPEQLAVGNELEKAIAEAMSRLPALQRAAVELKSWGYSQQEIAEILQVGASHAGVLVHRGRQSLAEWLAPLIDLSE